MAVVEWGRCLVVGLGLFAVTALLGCAKDGSTPNDIATQCSTKAPSVDPLNDLVTPQLRLVPSQQVVKSGELITITIDGDLPTGTQIVRGIDSYLECWAGSGWSTRFLMLTGNPPYYKRYPLPSGMRIEDLGLLGSGPEPVQIPETITPGWYRIRKEFRLERGPEHEKHTVYAYVTVTKN